MHWHNWICPSDRQLSLRSKLSKGWSSFRNRPVAYGAASSTRSNSEEFLAISRVLLDNDRLRAVDRGRIRNYASKLESLKSMAKGDGHTSCLLCGDALPTSLLLLLLQRPLPKFCSKKSRMKCRICGLDTCLRCGCRPHQPMKGEDLNWECKICHKEMQLWKKSGGWFYQRPPGVNSCEFDDNEGVTEFGDSRLVCSSAQVVESHCPTDVGDSLDGETNGLAAGAGAAVKYGATSTPERSLQPVPVSGPPGVHFEDRGLGALHFVLQYIPAKAALYIRVIKGEGLRAHDANGLSDPYVKMHLLPDTGKRTKLRTRTCHRTLNPLWDEEFCYSGVTKADIESKMLRLSVLDEDTIGFDWMGEVLYPLSHLLRTGRKEYSQVFLQPKNFDLDRSLKLEDDDRGKILISLYYAPAKTELSVRIIQCVNLIAMDPNGYSDPFVKIHLRPDNGSPKKFKTEVKRRTLNPDFEEEFQFIVTPQELLEKTLEITVWDKDFASKNDFMGALLLGSECQGERRSHWEVLLRQPYQRHERWHALWPELSM